MKTIKAQCTHDWVENPETGIRYCRHCDKRESNMKTIKEGHTPGPWKVLPIRACRISIKADSQKDNRIVCMIETSWASEDRILTHMANAALIASAPSLLMACKNLIGMVEFCGIEAFNPDFAKKIERTMKHAEEVVARAEGVA